MRIVCLPRHPAVAYLFLVRRQLAHTKEWHPVSVPLPRLSLAWLAHLSGLRSSISLPVGGRPCRRRFHGYSLLLGISLSAPALFPDGYCLSSVLLPWLPFSVHRGSPPTHRTELAPIYTRLVFRHYVALELLRWRDTASGPLLPSLRHPACSTA